MSQYLVDTNVISELTRPVPETKVEVFLKRSKATVYISVLSIGEIRKGIASLAVGVRRTSLEDWLKSEIMPWFGDRILPVTLEVAEIWGSLAGDLRSSGRSRPVLDALLAATALKNNLVVVTRNAKDYEGTGVSILNPWKMP